MSQPMNVTQWASVLKSEGVRVKVNDDASTHNRNGHGRWGDVKGVMVHHTAGTDSLRVCRNGTADLPGPLCHAHIDKSGLVTLISTGRTNHAGRGSRAVFDAVLREDATPVTGPDEVDGNAYFYGFEIENRGDGKDLYPEAQYDAVVRLVSAVCRHHGWDPLSVIGHKQWTKRKIDPSFSVYDFRDAVAARLAHDASWDPDASTPTPTGPKRPQAYKDVCETDAFPAPRPVGENEYWTLETYVRYLAEQTSAIIRKIAELSDKIDKL